MPIPECCEKMNLREDDLFLNFDADEIPKREVGTASTYSFAQTGLKYIVLNMFQVVTFLKLHSGYGDIQEFGMRYIGTFKLIKKSSL